MSAVTGGRPGRRRAGWARRPWASRSPDGLARPVLLFPLALSFSLALLGAQTAAFADSAGAASDEAAAGPRPLHALVLEAVGPGYAVTSEGPLDPATFAANSPDPAGASQALATLGQTVVSYQRVWLDGSHANAVQDLVVRFSSAAAAQIFLRAAEHALDSGEIVSSGPLASVPGAHRTTYFGSTSEPGVGEAITLRAGIYVALLSYFSASSGNPQPITPADAARVAQAQQTSLAAAPGGADQSAHGVTRSSLGWAALVVALLAAIVATPLVLQRRSRRSTPTVGGPTPIESGTAGRICHE